jgi:glutaredoxin
MMFEKGVVVFSGKDCPSCKTLKDTLNSKGVEYSEYDIWDNPEAMRFIMDKGFRSIPQLFKDGVKVGVEDV